MRERRVEWVSGIVFAALAGITLVVATSFIESAVLRLTLFGLALVGTFLAVLVLDAWFHATPTEGFPKFRAGFLRRTAARFRRRDWLAGVLALWLVAALVVGILSLVDPVTPALLWGGVVVIVVAAVVFLWADLTPATGKGERGA